MTIPLDQAELSALWCRCITRLTIPSIGWTLTYPVNFTSHPACSVPAGLVDGLPVGMQIIGPRLFDGDVLRAAAAIEQHRPWAARYPAILNGDGAKSA